MYSSIQVPSIRLLSIEAFIQYAAFIMVNMYVYFAGDIQDQRIFSTSKY